MTSKQRTLSVLVVVSMLLVSIVGATAFIGSVSAHSATAVQADNPVSSTGDKYTQQFHFQTGDMNASESASMTLNASGMNYTNVSSVSVISGSANVDTYNVGNNGEEITVDYTASSDISGGSISFEISDAEVDEGGTGGELTYTQSDGTTLTDDFQYGEYATANGISATDVSYDNANGTYKYDVELVDFNITSGENTTITLSHTDGNISATGVIVESTTTGASIPTTTNVGGGYINVTVNASQDFNSDNLSMEVSGFDITGDYAGGVSFDSVTNHTDTFNFAPVNTGHGEVEFVKKNDTDSNVSASVKVVNSSGDVIRSDSAMTDEFNDYPYGGEFSELGKLQTGTYNVTVYNVSGYENATKSITVSDNSTASINFSLVNATSEETTTVVDMIIEDTDSSAVEVSNVSSAPFGFSFFGETTEQYTISGDVVVDESEETTQYNISVGDSDIKNATERTVPASAQNGSFVPMSVTVNGQTIPVFVNEYNGSSFSSYAVYDRSEDEGQLTIDNEAVSGENVSVEWTPGKSVGFSEKEEMFGLIGAVEQSVGIDIPGVGIDGEEIFG